MNVYAELDDFYRYVKATRTNTGLVVYSMGLHTLLESVGIPNTYRPRLNVGEYQQLEIEIGYGMSFTLYVSPQFLVLANAKQYEDVEPLIKGIRWRIAAMREWYAKVQCTNCYYSDSDSAGYCGMGLVPVVDCIHKVVEGIPVGG